MDEIPKHPMEVIKTWTDTGGANVVHDYLMFAELVQSVRHYFSEANMPSDEEIESFVERNRAGPIDIPLEFERGFIEGYKAGIQRMKR